MSNATKAIFLSILAFCLGPLCHAGDIKCFVLRPPDQPIPDVKTIAILDFTGRSGRNLADLLIAALPERTRGISTIKGGLFSRDRVGATFLLGARTDVFTIVERSRLDQVLTEQQLTSSGMIDDAKAAALGKILGVDAIVSGSLTPTVEDTHSQEEHTYYRNKQQYTSTVGCTTRKVSVSATMRVINVTSEKSSAQVRRWRQTWKTRSARMKARACSQEKR